MQPFPFFVGRARSGTTLLQTIFDSHSQLAVPPESHFIVTLTGHDGRVTFERGRFIAELAGHPRFRLWGLTPDLVENHLERVDPGSYADAIRAVFGLYAAERGKPRYGDKTPGYVYHLTALARMFPEARFVHLIRDGRDAALSFLATEFASGGIAEAAFAWKVGVSRGRRAGRRLGPERYREIRYEELVEGPEGIVRDVAEFLDLAYEPEMLRYFDRAEEALRSTNHPAAHENLRLPPTKGLRDWRRDMSSEDVKTFELIAGDLLTELGYERATGARSLEDRRRLVRLQLLRVRRRAFRRTRGSRV